MTAATMDKRPSASSPFELWLGRTFRSSYRGALEFSIIVLCFAFADPNQISLIVGGAVSALGLILRIWTAGYGYKIGEISLRGPYHFVRHPYFLGTALLFFGLCLTGREPWVMAYALVTVSLAYRRDLQRDEASLARSFGPVFTEYRSRVPAFIPQLWPVDLPGAPRGPGFSFSYSMLTGRHRELDTVLGLAGAYGLYYLCYWLTAKDLFHLGVVGAATLYLAGRAIYFGMSRRPAR